MQNIMPIASTIESAILTTLAQELEAEIWQITAAVKLLDEGSTVPFIARYRKEVTGALNDEQLRKLDKRLPELRELEEERGKILSAIDERGQLTQKLTKAVVKAENQEDLQDLFEPYKSPEPLTAAQIARNAGLDKLADSLALEPALNPETEATRYFNVEYSVTTAKEALDGAKAVLTEEAMHDAELLIKLREKFLSDGWIRARVKSGMLFKGDKYKDYFDYSTPLRKLPSHQIHAMIRGEKENVLKLEFFESDPRAHTNVSVAEEYYEQQILQTLNLMDYEYSENGWLMEVAKSIWQGPMGKKIRNDCRNRLIKSAEEESLAIFQTNLKHALLAAPAGDRTVLGLDPGIRTGVKIAVVDGTGKILTTGTIYPHPPANKWKKSIHQLSELILQYQVDLIAIGNGTGSKETTKLVDELISNFQSDSPPLSLEKIEVDEAGASIYSASELASKELPDIDVTERGAVSLARRVQDPLAELVKIDPRSIGVGQYQHDLSPHALEQALSTVVEDCVNAVGVDLNTASPHLLARVAGLDESLGRSIVSYRDSHGSFNRLSDLRDVAGLNDRDFEQCAGFLRVKSGHEPFDALAIHPEAYGLARRISSAAKSKTKIGSLDKTSMDQVSPRMFVDNKFGLLTVLDVMSELTNLQRDPRPAFITPKIADNIHDISDLFPGMIVEGIITNVVSFGAFVNIGVHKDGLIHKSNLSRRIILDPREVVHRGQVVRAKVLGMDSVRKRIALSLCLDD